VYGEALYIQTLRHFHFQEFFMNRRIFLRNSSLLTLGAGLLPQISFAGERRKKYLPVAFLSDIHVKPTVTSEAGMRAAFRHVNNHSDKPAFIINGGDAIMDAMAADKTKTQAQWDVWNKVIREENKLPMYHVIGNHDAWGWQVKDESIKSDPLYDKGWVMQEHKMNSRYYSFTNREWKFIVLDTAHENNGGYIAKLDAPQFAWLEQELKSTNPEQHICIVSHIPIASFCSAMFADENQANGDWRISRALLMTDARKILQLFSQYNNIRCCLSGHIHLQDEVNYKGIQYFCNGAVSGNWWNGAFKGFDPAYALFRFYRDGRVERNIVSYG
jgi:3',5'-cyclic-AMP phosphodiesterase